MIRICDTYKQYLNNTTTKRIQQTNHYLLLKAGFHVSKDYITDTITLDKLVSLDYDDINYTKTIYRISEDDMIPTIEKTIKEKWMLGKQYRFETTKVNKLFYVENMDVQDISEYDGDTLMDLIDDGYKIINVIEKNMQIINQNQGDFNKDDYQTIVECINNYNKVFYKCCF